VDPLHPAPEAIARAVAVMRQDGLVIFPTRGLYGLGADALNPRAVARIFGLKGRDRSKPLLVLIHERRALEGLVAEVSPLAQFLMDRFWPGGVTFVLPARAGLPPGLTSLQGRIGVRLTGHPVARALAAALDGPLTGTSANLSGAEGCAHVTDLDTAVCQAADLILDAGPLAGGPGSTVVDVTAGAARILRHGAVAGPEIMAACKRFTAGAG
jgi:L-threonylcarbamoyladenylate synthase